MSENAELLARLDLEAQSGDVNAQLDAAIAYMSDNSPGSAAKAIHWIRKVFLTSSERVTPDQIVSANKSSIDVRGKTMALAKAGQPLVDMLIRASACKGCRDTSTDKTLIGLEGATFYRTVWDFIAWALLSSSSVQASEELCAVCQSPLEMLYIDYHHFVKEAGEDLVVRSLTFGFDPNKKYSLLWFNGENYRLVTQEDIRDEDKVDVDYFVKSINQYVISGNYFDATAAAKLALQQFPGEPALLETVEGLLSADQIGICEAIIDEHLNHRPGDPKGQFAKAELLMHKFRAATPPQMELLKQANDLISRSISTSGRKDWKEAELLLCDIARLSGEDALKTEASYKTCIDKFPDFAAARFGLGLHLLNSDPEKALEQFNEGTKLKPNDLNFPLGRAQALSRLNRFDEAETAINRARELNPTHPMIKIVADEIEKGRSISQPNSQSKTLH